MGLAPFVGPFHWELSRPLQRFPGMQQTYSYSFTDLDQFETEAIEVDLANNEVPDFGARVAEAVAEQLPDLRFLGMCVVLYDPKGKAISIAPIDTLH